MSHVLHRTPQGDQWYNHHSVIRYDSACTQQNWSKTNLASVGSFISFRKYHFRPRGCVTCEHLCNEGRNCWRTSGRISRFTVSGADAHWVGSTDPPSHSTKELKEYH